MKKTIILISLLASVFTYSESQNAEDKKIDNLKLISTTKGGCASSNKHENLKINKPRDIDKPRDNGVTFSVTNKNLDIIVSFNLECCVEYTTSSIIKNDTIVIDINPVPSETACDCICCYTYEFKYSGLTKTYNYKVNAGNTFYYKGIIKP